MKWLFRIMAAAYLTVVGFWMYQWITGIDALGLILGKVW